MPIFESGRVCMKIAGREAGKHCAVLEIVDNNFVVVSGPEVRKRKCNIAHLEPLQDKIDINSDVNKQLIEKYNIELPQPIDVAKQRPAVERKERKEEKEEKKEKPTEKKRTKSLKNKEEKNA